MENGAAREPKTLLEAVRYFSDQDRAFDFVKSLRWADGCVKCPRCGAGEPSFLTTRRRLNRPSADNAQRSGQRFDARQA